MKYQGQSLSPTKFEVKEGLDTDLLQLQRSASTHVHSNLMIRPPNWQKRRHVIQKRLKTGIKVSSEAPEETHSPGQRSLSPSLPSKKSSKKLRGGQSNLVMAKNIESVLEKFNLEMEKQWESGAMRKGLIKSNPHLKKKRYIFSKEEQQKPRGSSAALERSPDKITILETPERFPTHSI
mmetsp:Transcript_10061/g.15358  ORF Transcript_10061/g.15358 Transcript_10061/m.15358 type:complete len:179 (+) Transcript_10061:8217-8753(+)